MPFLSWLFGVFLIIFPIVFPVLLIVGAIYWAYTNGFTVKYLIPAGIVIILAVAIMFTYLSANPLWTDYVKFSFGLVRGGTTAETAPVEPIVEEPAAPVEEAAPVAEEPAAPVEEPGTTAEEPAAPVEEPAPVVVIPNTPPSEMCWDAYQVFFQAKDPISGLYKAAGADYEQYFANAEFLVFEGRLEAYANLDRTDILEVRADTPEFKFTEGSMWVFRTGDKCDPEIGPTIAIYRLGVGKMQGRINQNLTDKFILALTNPENGQVDVYEDAKLPVSWISGLSLDPNECRNLGQPVKQNSWGQDIDGSAVYRNFSFGAVKCQSVVYATFGDGTYALRLYDVRDNIVAKYQGFEHYLFPTDWSDGKINDWIKSKWEGVEIKILPNL